jgi:hypothetical protein
MQSTDRSHGGENVCAAPNSPHNFCTHILAGDQTVAHGVRPTSVVVGEWVPRGKARSEEVYWSNNAAIARAVLRWNDQGRQPGEGHGGGRLTVSGR